MKVCVWSSVKWNNFNEANAFGTELRRWLSELDRTLSDHYEFLVSGTYSDTTLCPVNVPVINAEVKYTKSHSFGKWDYAKCAGTTGFWKAFFDKQWDVLLYTDTTVLINCNLEDHLRSFLESGKHIMCCEKMWGNMLDNGFSAYSRDGVIHYLHSRTCADLQEQVVFESEKEMTEIFKGQVYNPWPTVPHCRRDLGTYIFTESQEDEMLNSWPAITKPSPRLVRLHREKYATNHEL